MIEQATTQYYKLQENGADDEIVQQQLDSIRDLNERKKQAEQYYREIDDMIDEANERQNDGYGGQ